MHILLQDIDDKNVMKMECIIAKTVMDSHNGQFCYSIAKKNVFEQNMYAGQPFYKDTVPIGTIEFVSSWLKMVHQKSMNPIEIPKCLRTDEFLKRDYKILPFHELPKEGKWFIKDVSVLKSFTNKWHNNVSDIDFNKAVDDDRVMEHFGLEPVYSGHMYQVSEYVDIKSEYRAYFIEGELESLCNYDGSLSYYPDVSLLNKANAIYSMQPDYPKSYTMDVMITDRGTSIIEIHPFVSVGLYSNLWGPSLIYAYRDGIDYYVNHNTPAMPS